MAAPAAHTRMFADIHDPGLRVRALCNYGCNVDIDTRIPPRRYFRSGLEMIRMADVYLEEGQLESAFILYSKFITLFVEKLPSHPEYKAAPPDQKQQNKKKVKSIFIIAEEIKKKLKKRYEDEEVIRQEELKRQQEELAKQEAIRKAEEEKRRKEEELRLEEEAKRRLEDEERWRQEQEEQYHLLQEQERKRLLAQQEAEDRATALALAGLTVEGSVPHAPPSGPPPAYGSVVPPGAAPTVLPPGAVPVLPSGGVPPVPSRDLKPSAPPPDMPTAGAYPTDNGVPNVDRSSKPDHFMSTGGLTGNKYGLRDVICSPELIVKFSNIAQPNNNKNIETLGLLCGKLNKGAFRITHLVIPKQSGTSDSCDMEGEDEIFDIQDKYDLITLGWIHTHPTQTAFLSSVDLHTHFPYQQMMPEAIAIVISPKFQETGYFNLTPNGLVDIGGCRERGFHYHQKEPPLFENCQHVREDRSCSVTVIDLRR